MQPGKRAMNLLCPGSIISKTAGDTNSIIMEQLQQMAHGVSNGNVTGDVT